MSYATQTTVTVSYEGTVGGSVPYRIQLQKALDAGGHAGAYADSGSPLLAQVEPLDLTAENLTPNTAYWWRVLVTDAAGSSTYSNELQVSTTSPTGKDEAFAYTNGGLATVSSGLWNSNDLTVSAASLLTPDYAATDSSGSGDSKNATSSASASLIPISNSLGVSPNHLGMRMEFNYASNLAYYQGLTPPAADTVFESYLTCSIGTGNNTIKIAARQTVTYSSGVFAITHALVNVQAGNSSTDVALANGDNVVDFVHTGGTPPGHIIVNGVTLSPFTFWTWTISISTFTPTVSGNQSLQSNSPPYSASLKSPFSMKRILLVKVPNA